VRFYFISFYTHSRNESHVSSMRDAILVFLKTRKHEENLPVATAKNTMNKNTSYPYYETESTLKNLTFAYVKLEYPIIITIITIIITIIIIIIG
jgi:hypothetical protein